MYKLLLCWRYLRTRYIALASIVSVMLGVATLVVVNAVMEGAQHELQGRINGVLGDVIVQARTMDGAPDPEGKMRLIREVAGDYIEGMSPSAVVPAAVQYNTGGQVHTHQIMLVGIDPETHPAVSDIGQYLQHPENRDKLSFDLKEGGYDVIDHQEANTANTMPREALRDAGWPYRRKVAPYRQPIVTPPSYSDRKSSDSAEASLGLPQDPFLNGNSAHKENVFDSSREIHTGCIPGIGLCSYRTSDAKELFFVRPGDDVTIMFPSSGQMPEPRSAKLTVTDLYESKLEYDSSFLFMPFYELQKLRGLVDPKTNVTFFNSILIRLKPGVEADVVKDLLSRSPSIPEQFFSVQTWRERQGPILAAIQTEAVLLNILLFMIIAVAGFGILAIFLMIVVEKTRDIGILKSLGASGAGVMGIFMAYGLLLGAVGAGAGIAGGLVIVAYINDIKDFVSWATGAPVFDPSVYNFLQIPAIVEPLTVIAIALGAMTIAVLASIFPAWRAASLHPVQALRWE